MTDRASAQATLLKSFSATAYAFLCYTTDVWDAYNDDIVKLRKKLRILRGGLQLATNNMPQGELLPIPLQRTIGYQHQTHVVIHFRNAEPDLGRKGFQPELQEAAEQAAVGLVNHLKKWRNLMRKDSGGPPKIIGEGELYEWIKEQEEYQKNHPLKSVIRISSYP
jgi:hypothetical protein